MELRFPDKHLYSLNYLAGMRLYLKKKKSEFFDHTIKKNKKNIYLFNFDSPPTLHLKTGNWYMLVGKMYPKSKLGVSHMGHFIVDIYFVSELAQGLSKLKDLVS